MTQKHVYDLVAEPAGIVFSKLMAWALGVATQLGLVVHSSRVKLSPAALQFLEEMNPYLVRRQEVSEWPGTRLIGERRGIVHIYHLTPESVALFIATADRLFEWVNPSLPEDPHLLREDGSVLMGSVTQEEDSWMELTSDEFEALVREVPGIEGALQRRP